MKNIIITSIKKPKLNNIDNLNFLNNNEECIICSQNIDLENLDYVIIINKVCKCYNAVKMCKKCLFIWISNNNTCFICRKSYNINYSNRHKIYYTNNDNLNKKLVECTKKTQYSSIDINDNIPNDIIVVQTIDVFTFNRSFRFWLHERKYTFLRYMLCYLFITVVFISIDKTIKYDNMDYNETHAIIW
jgi:hypothetical protein